MGKADIHVHTTHSKDAATTVRGVLKQASLIGLDIIAVTDHDEIEGALEARELAPRYNVEVVTGTEVSSSEGHVLALFVEEKIPKGLTLAETLLWIGGLGGIAIAPHPINWMPGSLGMEALISAIANKKTKKIIKGIEVFNMGHAIFNRRAQKFSRFLPLSRVAASDSHVYWTVGKGHTEFVGNTARDFRAALENFSTVPVPAAKSFSPLPILAWTGSMALRPFGYVAENNTPDEPVKIQRALQPR